MGPTFNLQCSRCGMMVTGNHGGCGYRNNEILHSRLRQKAAYGQCFLNKAVKQREKGRNIVRRRRLCDSEDKEPWVYFIYQMPGLAKGGGADRRKDSCKGVGGAGY